MKVLDAKILMPVVDAASYTASKLFQIPAMIFLMFLTLKGKVLFF